MLFRSFALRDDLVGVLPFLRERYPTYESYAEQTVADIFTATELADAVQKETFTFATSLARNNGDGSFTLVPLPLEAQLAPVYGILAAELDGDGVLDLLLAGNFDGVKPEIGRLAGSFGGRICFWNTVDIQWATSGPPTEAELRAEVAAMVSASVS